MKPDIEMERLKARMTPEERDRMAQLVANEVERRRLAREKGENLAVGYNQPKPGVSHKDDADEAVRRLYAELGGKIKEVRAKKVADKTTRTSRKEGQLSPHALYRLSLDMSGRVQGQIKDWASVVHHAMGSLKARVSAGAKSSISSNENQGISKVANVRSSGFVVLGESLLIVVVVVLSGLKLFVSDHGGALTQSLRLQGIAEAADSKLDVNAESLSLAGNRKEEVKSEEKSLEREELLQMLDARRVDLVQRRDSLAERESELSRRENDLAERMAELRKVVARAEELRKENDIKQTERMEQLAGVYASMQPKDAATLLEKLDSDIALRVLQYLPGKRTGQILSVMNPGRAVELTRQLSVKGVTSQQG